MVGKLCIQNSILKTTVIPLDPSFQAFKVAPWIKGKRLGEKRVKQKETIQTHKFCSPAQVTEAGINSLLRVDIKLLTVN